MKNLLNVLLLMLTALLVTGCANNSLSLLQRSIEVNRQIESNTVLPDHNYYYAGPQDKPDTIVAIHKNYEFVYSIHWNPVDISEKQLWDWNIVISNDTRFYDTYDGYYILSPAGEKVGIFYSKYDFTSVKFPAPNQVTIYRPDPGPQQRKREALDSRW